MHKLQHSGIITKKNSLKAVKITSRIEANYLYKDTRRRNGSLTILDEHGKREIGRLIRFGSSSLSGEDNLSKRPTKYNIFYYLSHLNHKALSCWQNKSFFCRTNTKTQRECQTLRLS